MEEKNINENIDLCRKCGGKCCVKCGCDYAVDDFSEHTYKAFLEELSKGDKSIVAMLNFRTLPNGKFVAEPFLYIRARNVNRDVVDLVSMKARCSMLTDEGCSYDYLHRPFGGRNLRPSPKGVYYCSREVEQESIMKKWLPYQKTLGKIVKHYTGKSVNEKVKEDVETLFCDILRGNFQDVSRLEIEELDGFIPLLKRAFPDERYRANVSCRGTGLKVFNKK